jgi:dTDP-D-glucose 4,6-dehydratase
MLLLRIKLKLKLAGAETMFKEGIKLTIKWFFENEEWMKNVTSGDYQKYYQDMYSGNREA